MEKRKKWKLPKIIGKFPQIKTYESKQKDPSTINTIEKKTYSRHITKPVNIRVKKILGWLDGSVG